MFFESAARSCSGADVAGVNPVILEGEGNPAIGPAPRSRCGRGSQSGSCSHRAGAGRGGRARSRGGREGVGGNIGDRDHLRYMGEGYDLVEAEEREGDCGCPHACPFRSPTVIVASAVAAAGVVASA
jgi:hypothetical protein